MKIAFIATFYRIEEQADVERLEKEIRSMGMPDWRLFATDQSSVNKGYAAGINKGIRKALAWGADLFVVMNLDISLSRLTKTSLITGFDHFDIWGGVTNQKGGPYYGGVIDPWRMSGGLSTVKPGRRFQPVDFVSGSFMAIKRKVIEEVGLLDERFFIYYEEVDYCIRAKKKGFRVGIDSSLVYDHFETSDKINPKKQFLLARNRFRILLKYGSWQQKLYEAARIPKTLLEMIAPALMNQSKTKGFLFNFMSLNVSSILSKAGSFLLFLFLIGSFGPKDYGLYVLVWAQVMLFSPIVDLGTTSYGIVHLPQERGERLISLSSLRIAVSFLVFVVTLAASFLMFPGRFDLVWLIFLAAASIFSGMFSGTYLIFNAVNSKLYNSSLVSTTFQFFLTIGLILTVVLTKSVRAVFLTVFFFYSMYSLINLFLIKKNIPNFRFIFAPKDWLALIKKTYVFVLIGFFATLYFKIDVFLLARLKGEQAVGVYSAGYKFFEASMFLVASYNISATPIFAKLKANTSMVIDKMKKDILILVSIGVSAVLVFWAASFLILPILMKGTYVLSIPVLRIVILALPLILINSVFFNVLYVYKKAGIVVLVFMFQALLNALLNILLIPGFSYFASSYITVFSEVCNIIVLLFLFNRYVPRKT